MNLDNLRLLQSELSINDMHDALEALDVAQSWSEATVLNQLDDAPKGR